MNQSQIEHFMLEAMCEGRKARNKCFPNPPVGCVLVKNGEIIARGHTNEPGQPHAEAMALQQINEGRGITAFVTLEPCSFHGRTPSCAKALIKSGIECVYVGITDPDPRNNGVGIALLEKAGIRVQTGILADQVRQDLEPFLLSA
ncbi:bifunctional diaminohydroxyphosphoribosylaminopyrimidine deaminase/5-amino-6-(5-phosphoribosylamino)uracil reductase RibD [Endozoicomonadaceae bacterium StTr2]